jgi:isopentenyl-diphosphate delta-isomerase
MNEDYVILVDEKDQQIGLMEKLEAHQKGVLHRAFSVFIFNSKKELLLQRRAIDKYHCGGLWTNTCCSHQKEKETNLEAGRRRLKEEMGMKTELKEAFSFIYRAEFDNHLVEHEYDHVLIGYSDSLPEINSLEVCDFKYDSLDNIKQEIKLNPELFTPWFKLIIDKFQYQINSF